VPLGSQPRQHPVIFSALAARLPMALVKQPAIDRGEVRTRRGNPILPLAEERKTRTDKTAVADLNVQPRTGNRESIGLCPQRRTEVWRKSGTARPISEYLSCSLPPGSQPYSACRGISSLRFTSRNPRAVQNVDGREEA
jgi:hypothetical protein